MPPPPRLQEGLIGVRQVEDRLDVEYPLIGAQGVIGIRLEPAAA